MDILEIGKDTRQLFEIHILDDGKYAAIRETSPIFFLTGDTIREATEKAIGALESYRSFKEKK